MSSNNSNTPLCVAVGVACGLAGFLLRDKTQKPPAVAKPAVDDARDISDERALSDGGGHPRALSKGGEERTISLVVSDHASRNTVDALLRALSRLQSASSDITVSEIGGFADDWKLNGAAAENVIGLPKRGGDAPQGALNIEALRAKMTLADVDLRGKRVLVRVDYNCPTDDATQTITDSSRIDSTVPTLRACLDAGGARCVVLIAHRGRPGGDYKRAEFTLAPCVAVLRAHFPEREVRFLDDCVGADVEAATRECAPGTILLLENLRFHFEECGSGVKRDGAKVKPSADAVAAFQASLARLGDVFVFEGFGAAHRPHASIVGCAAAPHAIAARASGLLVEKEIAVFADVLSTPRRPFLSIVGGAKVTDKIAVLENLLDLVDVLFVGGAMAYTFKKVLGELEIGASLFDDEGARLVAGVVAKAKRRGVRLLLPTDHVVADAFAADARTGVVDDADGVPAGWLALDAGPASRAALAAEVARAQTVLWNGPLGVCEMGAFSSGTLHVMRALVAATERGATTVLGGGDTGAAARRFCVRGAPIADLVTHTSTGGGTSLVLMEGKELPAVTALTDRKDAAPGAMTTTSARCA